MSELDGAAATCVNPQSLSSIVKKVAFDQCFTAFFIRFLTRVVLPVNMVEIVIVEFSVTNRLDRTTQPHNDKKH
ncbi:hypothetical protein GCM10025791_21320 [Halioxenophilus aromaticivorans]|uniref:Uncharacterized protein n=1 Tax=Halioxenophilus aromaticivorans TaxID=1306992 RepID=A0AAV3U1U0_9ALTE